METQNSQLAGMPAQGSKIGLIAGVIALLVVGGFVGYFIGNGGSSPVVYQTPQSSATGQTATPSSTVSESPAPTSTSTTVTQSKIYSNQYMTVTIPAGWSYSEAYETIQNKTYDKKTNQTYLVGTPVTRKTGAINIMKNNYILYINPQATPVGGAEGGRLSEIGMGAPSFDAVAINPPQPPCETPIQGPTVQDFRRYDLYVSSANTKGECNKPSSGTVWYFSYLSRDGGYFNGNLVITMAYNSRDVNMLPKKGSATLNTMLAEMTSIAGTLEVK